MSCNENGRCGCQGQDFGKSPLIINMELSAEMNHNYRTAVWTGKYMQVTLMCIPVGGEIGLEVHEDTDQLLQIVQGSAMVRLGTTRNTVRDAGKIDERFAVVVPAGTWHNIINCGDKPLKLYSVYAPPHHRFGTVQATRREAERA